VKEKEAHLPGCRSGLFPESTESISGTKQEQQVTSVLQKVSRCPGANCPEDEKQAERREGKVSAQTELPPRCKAAESLQLFLSYWFDSHRLQPPRDPTVGISGCRKWMNGFNSPPVIQLLAVLPCHKQHFVHSYFCKSFYNMKGFVKLVDTFCHFFNKMCVMFKLY